MPALAGMTLLAAGLQLEAARGIEVKLQAKRGRARETQHHRLPPCGRKALFDRIAHELRTVTIGEQEPGAGGNDLAREIGRDSEIEAVAEGKIVFPLAVGAKVEEARFDLDDDDIARSRQRHHIGAPTIGEREFGDDGVPKRAKGAAYAPLQRGSRRRLPAFKRIDGIVPGSIFLRKADCDGINSPHGVVRSLTIPRWGTSW